MNHELQADLASIKTECEEIIKCYKETGTQWARTPALARMTLTLIESHENMIFYRGDGYQGNVQEALKTIVAQWKEAGNE